MKSLFYALAIAGALQLASVCAYPAEATKTYQVTGPVLEVTDKVIVVQKGDDRWEIARDAKTKVDGELKVGNKVTIKYRMVAVSVDAGSEKSSGKKQSK